MDSNPVDLEVDVGGIERNVFLIHRGTHDPPTPHINGSEAVDDSARDSFVSDNSEAVFDGPGYDFYLTWVPLPFLSAGVASERGGNVVRNDLVNTFFFNRDETRFAFSVTARG